MKKKLVEITLSVICVSVVCYLYKNIYHRKSVRKQYAPY